MTLIHSHLNPEFNNLKFLKLGTAPFHLICILGGVTTVRIIYQKKLTPTRSALNNRNRGINTSHATTAGTIIRPQNKLWTQVHRSAFFL